MAAGLIGNGGGRRGRFSPRYRPMAEINVTPLVDVMLVLLIIFMIAAPLLTVGVQVDLPRTTANPLPNPDEPLSVTINGEGRIFIQETPVEMEELIPRLRAIAEARAGDETRIFVRGDRAISYGRVMEVMGRIAASGFTRVALLAEQPSGAPEAGAPAVRTPAAGTPTPPRAPAAQTPAQGAAQAPRR